MADYEEFFINAGITSETEKTAILNYIGELFDIAITTIIKND